MYHFETTNEKTPLGPTPFDAYREHRDVEMSGHFGEQNIFRFPNGLTVSVIKHIGSYGYNHNLFEVAVFKDGGEFVTKEIFDWDDDVMGNLTERSVIDCLQEVVEK